MASNRSGVGWVSFGLSEFNSVSSMRRRNKKGRLKGEVCLVNHPGAGKGKLARFPMMSLTRFRKDSQTIRRYEIRKIGSC